MDRRFCQLCPRCQTVPPFPITAYSACNALGSTTSEVVASLAASRTGLGAPPASFALEFETAVGAVRGELPAPPPELLAYDSHEARLALQTVRGVHDALSTALRRWGAGRVAVVMGTSTGGISATEDAYAAFKKSGALDPKFDYRKQHSFHAFAELLAKLYGIGGPVFVVSTACSSSGKVLSSARRLIRAGVVDAALVGGVDSLAHTTLRGFKCLSVLSEKPCRPFGVDRTGISIGEGGAMLVLERPDTDARARALLLGVGESSDAHHMSSPHPEGLGARLAMERALAEAGVRAGAVDHVNAHGTGTRHNDAAEALAIESVFGDRVPVASTKGFTGHLLGAAGATEAVFGIVALEQGWIPANLGGAPLDPAVHIDVNLARKDLACRRVLSNSFGFGGSNVAVLLGAAS